MEFYKEVERNIIKKYRKELYRPFVKALDKYELIKENDKILDVGTGTGMLIPFVHQHNPKGNIKGVDKSINMIEIAKEASKNVPEVTVKEGRIASGDQFVAGGEIAERIKSNFGEVSAVEMEGAAMAQVAYLNEVPYVILRSISDKANGEAELSYEEFLPIAAKNASKMVEEFIKLY